jgi:hypothetical protein
MRLRAFASVSLAAIGCGGSAAPPPVSAPAPKVEAASPVTASARTASPELRRRWPLGDDAEFVLYADLAGFVKTELVRGLVPELLALARGSMSEVQRDCVGTLIDGIGEVAVGAKESGPIFLVRFDDAKIKPGPSACLREVASGQPGELAGAKAFAVGDDVVALQPGLLIFGKKQLVEEALKPDASRKWPSGLDLGKDTHLAWRATMRDENVLLQGTLASSHDFFRVDVKADVGSEQAAADLESKIVEGRKELASRMAAAEPAAKAAIPLFDSLRLAREGRMLSFALDLREPPVEQARDVGIIAGIAVSGVRRYLAESKMTEARANLTVIAKNELEVWRALPRAKRRLSSLPPVPKEVPHATKYQSSPGDWKRWEGLKFALNSPQYFQYEVVASKDGKHADIIARGDLNGDGRSSEFKRTISVNPKDGALEVGPIEEKDPGE